MRETKQAEKETMPKQQRGITVEIPGYQKLQMRYLILDYNGTIALDGTLQKGVAERLQQLSEQLKIYIVTADTHGTVRKLCQQLRYKYIHFRQVKRQRKSERLWKRLALITVSA